MWHFGAVILPKADFRCDGLHVAVSLWPTGLKGTRNLARVFFKISDQVDHLVTELHVEPIACLRKIGGPKTDDRAILLARTGECDAIPGHINPNVDGKR